MPTNLPPQYFEKEKELKKANTPQERIAILEELLAIVPKHKGTEKLQALLKTKIAKLKIQDQKSPAGARHTATFQVEKTGAGQVAEDFLTLLAKLEEKRIELFPQEYPIPPDKQQFMKKTMIIANKCDHPRAAENLEEIKSFIDPGFTPIPVSIFKENTLEDLKEQIYILLNVIRVYSKIPGKKVNHNDPYVFKKGSSLIDMAKAVHKDFSQKLKYARIWGKNKYQGQKVNRSYILEDEDIIELHL